MDFGIEIMSDSLTLDIIAFKKNNMSAVATGAIIDSRLLEAIFIKKMTDMYSQIGFLL